MSTIKNTKPKKYSGWYGDCSQQQLKILDQFRIFVKNYNDGVLKTQWDDYYLLRFLRARKFSSVQTQKMWKKFIQWRKANDIDNSFKFFLPQIPMLRKSYPHGYHKVDKLGRPIYIQKVGSINIDEVYKISSEQKLLKYYSLSYQTLITKIFDACTKSRISLTGQQTRVQQTCTILDLKHVSLSNASKAYNFVKPASAMAQDNYPQILGNMFIINAPFLFTGIWAIVKVWIDQKTKQKIKILGSSYKKQLLQYVRRVLLQVDPQNLPSFIDGGTCKCQKNGGDCLSWNIGPWNPEGKELFQTNITGNFTEQKPKKQQKQQQKKEQKKQQQIEQQTKQQTKQQSNCKQQIKLINQQVNKLTLEPITKAE